MAGMSSLTWTLAQPMILGLPIDSPDYRFSVTLCFGHKKSNWL
jgi:hypothetical protein